MKNLSKILVLCFVLITAFSSVVMASGDEYIIEKEIIYKNERRKALSSGFIEVLVGNTNFTQYQVDKNITITPLPDEIKEDEFGNMYAYFDVTGLLPRQQFKISIKRECELDTFYAEIPARTDSIINEETEFFLEAGGKIESDNPEIIAKANEITEEMTTDYKKAQAIFEYVNVNMTYDESSAYANKGSLSALNSMRGVCEEFATLFVALCRAVNVPSRVVEGYKVSTQVSGDINGESIEYKELTNHVWAEIYLNGFGWVPVEPTVIYEVVGTGERKAYWNSFCNIEAPEYVAIGIYTYENLNRRFSGVEEISYKETATLVENQVVERQNQFTDLSNYNWAAEQIQALYGKGIIEGYSDTVYAPENSITRIEFICMLSRLLNYYDNQQEERGMVYYYTDYDESHWSKEDYDYLLRCYQMRKPSDIASLGFDAITDVFGVGTFNMNKAITRAEAVALIDLFLDDSYDDMDFSDVSYSYQFRDSIMKASSNGIVNGYPDGTFRPNNSISRAEAAVILGRFITNDIYTMSY